MYIICPNDGCGRVIYEQDMELNDFSLKLSEPIYGATRIIVCPQCYREIFVKCNSKNYQIVEINDVMMSKYLTAEQQKHIIYCYSK